MPEMTRTAPTPATPPGQRNFVMAGVTTDVCVMAPAISALEVCFNMKGGCDACGGCVASIDSP